MQCLSQTRIDESWINKQGNHQLSAEHPVMTKLSEIVHSFFLIDLPWTNQAQAGETSASVIAYLITQAVIEKF